MKRFFLFAVAIYSLTLTAMAQHTMQSDWLAKWSNAAAYTLAVAEVMPEEEYGFKPVDSLSMSFGEQMLHLADNINWLSSSKLRDGERPAKSSADASDKVAVKATLEQAFASGAQALIQLNVANLDQEVNWFTGETLTRRRVALLMFDHVTHHRAQAIVYLRLRGQVPPPYVGW